MRHACIAVLVAALLAAASAPAFAQPQLTRATSGYLLVLDDAANSLRIEGMPAPPPPQAVLELVPAGADLAPWSVGPVNCAQNVQSYAVSCTGDPAPLTIQAGGGADTVSGATSPVSLIVDGGAGRDYLTGGPGDDVFLVRDGEVDIVDCGPGQDSVLADPDDALYGCEQIDLPAPPPSVSPPDAPAPAPAPVSPAPVSPAPATPSPGPSTSAPSRIPGVIGYRFTTARAFARFSRLTVRGLPLGAASEVRCRGRGCPPRRLRALGTEASFTSALRTLRLRRGAVLEVRLTAPGYIGRVVRFTVARKRVRSATLCLAPGTATPARC